MEHDELRVMLGEVMARDLSDHQKAQLVERLAVYLRKTADGKLEWFFTVTSLDNPVVWEKIGASSTIHAAFGKWAVGVPAAASAWLDQQIQAGRFEDSSLEQHTRARSGFERELVKLLWRSDPDLVGPRLMAMSAQDAAAAFSPHPNEIREEDWLTFATLARDCLDREHALSKLGAYANFVSDYPTRSRFLDAISATPEERETTVQMVADSLATQKLFPPRGEPAPEPTQMISLLDELRGWGAEHHPDIDKAIGGALASRLSFMKPEDFDRVTEVLLHYQASNDRDEMIIEFLSDPDIDHFPTKAREVAMRIRDPEARDSVIRKLATD